MVAQLTLTTIAIMIAFLVLELLQDNDRYH
jgi:hypothetical protein